MLSPADIHAQALRHYPALLRANVSGEAFFPKDVRFGRPDPSGDWATLQAEISALAQARTGYEIEWEYFNTRRWGRQRLPVRVWFRDESAYLGTIGKTAEVERFRETLTRTRRECPELEGWLGPHVLRLVEHAADWPGVLHVCRYFIDHPRPGRYARELPIPVGTKFIEERKPLFRSLLDFLLPTSAVVTASDHFETRYGLRFDEPLIRMRLLDPALAATLGMPASDLSIPLAQCRLLGWEPATVLIVENKMTFLTLPALTGTLALWGGGNAAALLTTLPWFARCQLVYWGDLDIHGFHILDQFRQSFPTARSILMEAALLDRFAAFRVAANAAAYESTAHLTAEEQATYARLRQERTLLEQEKIPHAYAAERLRSEVAPDPDRR